MNVGAGVITVTLLIALAPPSRADTAKDCIAADTKAQSLRREGKLRAAREQLLICGAATCPDMVKSDCAQRMDDLERTTPTIVFAARTTDGHDVLDVKVTMDGAALTDKLDGSAIAVDVGPHEFAFAAAGQPGVREQLVMREGEKARHETIIFPVPARPAGLADAARKPATPVAPVATPPVSAFNASPATPEGSSGAATRAVGWTIAGVGVAGVGLGIVLGVLGSDKNNQVLADCPTGGCTQGTAAYTQSLSDRATASDLFTGMTVAFIAGGTAIVGGIIIVLVAPHRSASHGAAALHLQPTLLPGGGGGVISGVF